MALQTNGLDGHNGQNVQKLLQTLEGINAETFVNDGERTQAVLAAYALVSRLETPWEFVARLCMGQVHAFSNSLELKLKGDQPALGAALKVGKDLQLFEKWHDCGDGEMTGERLSEIVSCDSTLLGQRL